MCKKVELFGHETVHHGGDTDNAEHYDASCETIVALMKLADARDDNYSEDTDILVSDGGVVVINSIPVMYNEGLD